MSTEINKVYRTKDYSIFKIHNLNRDIERPHVNYLKRKMAKGWAAGSHIIIDGKGNVIDGQHRLMAAKEMGIAVEYIIEKRATEESMSTLNKGKKNWNIITHLKSFVKKGNSHYVALNTFMINFPELRPTECTMLVKNSNSSADREQFEEGRFTVADMKIAYEWGHNIVKLKGVFEQYNKSLFVRAMIKSLQNPQFIFDEFLHKAKLRRSMLFPCGTVDQYLGMIENVYNYKRKITTKVSLTDKF